MATNLSFTTLGLMRKEFDFYYPNGSFYQTVHSNGTVNLPTSPAWQVVLRPSKTGIIEDPMDLLVNYVLPNLSDILMTMLVLTLVAFLIRRR